MSKFSARATSITVARSMEYNSWYIGWTCAGSSSSTWSVAGWASGLTSGQAGRSARGVRGIDRRPDDCAVDLVVTRPGMSILTVCENGFGKRTRLEEYRKTRRGGKGVINIKATDRNGNVVVMQAVTDDDELMVITAKGIMLRTDLSAAREIGRATQGVRLIRLDQGDKVVAVARVARETNGNKKPDEIGDKSEQTPSGG
ncbi:MAG: hypothetical protein IIA33_11690, partial [Planctomycetes bacterium]|nr:hypothetical protein [Planctomycetota bacterium]